MLKINKLQSFSVSGLIFCFSLSNVNTAGATQIVESSPIIVQPYDDDLRAISQEMMAQDRLNRDQELAIRGLINDNQKLTDTALARQQDATLEKVNETMAQYRDFLINRDKLRIEANSRRISKYHDLVALTENVDDMKGEGQALKQKSMVIEDKYKYLTELKDEMQALNEKLKGEAGQGNSSPLSPQQNDKIQMLTQRLAEMDQRIAHYDQVIAEKDSQIAQLKNKVDQQDHDLKARDESIRWLKEVLAAAKSKAEYYQLSSQQNQAPLQQVQKEVQRIKDDYAQRFKVYEQFEKAIASLKSQVAAFGAQLSRKQEQVDLLKSELENKITEAKSDDRLNMARQLITLQQKQTALLEEKNRLRDSQSVLYDQHVRVIEDKMKEMLADKHQKDLQEGALRKHTDQMTLIMSDYQKKLESRDNAYNQQLKQALLSKNGQTMMEERIADLNARLQQKEAEISEIKKDMADQQEARDLNTATIEQKAAAKKDKEIAALKADLALARQQLAGMPSSDEIDFLRTGLKQATDQLKQKDEMISQIKANAEEYKKEFTAQSMQFQSLKDQLQNAEDDLARRNEDLKYKKLELTRFKEQTVVKEGNLLDQVKALTRKLQAAEKRLKGAPLSKEETQVILPPGNDALNQKLKQALLKIDEQGRMINVLAQKLQDAGQTVDLTQDTRNK